MEFLYPGFLLALLALAIPIILHLFYFRRFKKVYFTNVRFLKEVKEQTSARSKLRNLLVLLMRLLAVAMLVFAFAQPYLPRDKSVQQGRKAVSIYIDNSFSMEGKSQDVTLLEKARQRAREIVAAFDPDDDFQILTNDFEGKHQRLVGQEDALALIDDITSSPATETLGSVLRRQQRILQTSSAADNLSYLLSDFQEYAVDLDNWQDTSMRVSLVPLQAVQERNISIDSAWFEEPVQMLQQTNTLVVKLSNKGREAAENVRLSFFHEGQNKPVGTVNVPAGGFILDTINVSVLRTGWHEARLEITDYPITFDDTYFLSFYVQEKINILVVNELESNVYVDAAFRGIAYFSVDNQFSRNLDYSRFKDYQLIICNELPVLSSGLAFELQQFVRNGGNVLVFPSVNMSAGAYDNFLDAFPANRYGAFEAEVEKQVSGINTEEFVFRDVFQSLSSNLKLPLAKASFQFNGFMDRAEEPLMTYRDGRSFLSKFKIDKGHLYLCAAPLDIRFNDLVVNGEIFVPMLYKMALSRAAAEVPAWFIGRDNRLEADHIGQSADIMYRMGDQDTEFIPEQRIVGSKVIIGTGEQVRRSGWYRLWLEKDKVLKIFAFNYDRKESQQEFLAATALQQRFGERFSVIDLADAAVSTDLIAENSEGRSLWRWFVVLALLFLAIETLLLRFWKA